MICIVCEEEVSQSDIAPDLHLGDYVICKECNKITPNRKQAVDHWGKRAVRFERLRKLEVAVKGELNNGATTTVICRSCGDTNSLIITKDEKRFRIEGMHTSCIRCGRYLCDRCRKLSCGQCRLCGECLVELGW
jgi:hypothetical protein